MQRYQENDTGIPIRVTVTLDGAPVDISSATTRQILIKRIAPVGALKTFTATLPGGGTDGVLQYVTQTGDLSPTGRYQIQARLALGGSYDYRTDVGEFEIAGNLS
jgi:hypothetical protein